MYERPGERPTDVDADAVRAALADIAPDFADLTSAVAFVFDDVYGQRELDLRSRQIATVTAFVTLGERTQLRTTCASR